jgi:hypothetical protein
MGLILVIIVVLIVFGGLPMAPWGGWHQLGWGPSGLGAILLLILVVLLLTGRL